MEIYNSMIAVMSAVGAIEKTSTNKEQGFKFRGIDDIYAKLQKHLVDAKVFVLPTVLKSEYSERPTRSGGIMQYCRLKIRYRFYSGIDGSFVDSVVVGEAADAGDKSTSKAMSIAMKYCILQTFCIPTEEEKDPDFRTVEFVKTQPQAPKQKELPIVDPEAIKAILTEIEALPTADDVKAYMTNLAKNQPAEAAAVRNQAGIIFKQKQSQAQ